VPYGQRVQVLPLDDTIGELKSLVESIAVRAHARCCRQLPICARASILRATARATARRAHLLIDSFSVYCMQHSLVVDRRLFRGLDRQSIR
jgi:hypothetical protein